MDHYMDHYMDHNINLINIAIHSFCMHHREKSFFTRVKIWYFLRVKKSVYNTANFIYFVRSKKLNVSEINSAVQQSK